MDWQRSRAPASPRASALGPADSENQFLLLVELTSHNAFKSVSHMLTDFIDTPIMDSVYSVKLLILPNIEIVWIVLMVKPEREEQYMLLHPLLKGFEHANPVSSIKVQ